jgi:hypothetical protein
VLKGRIARTWLSSRLLGIAACVVFPLFAREHSDVLVMKNGDRITCSVKTLEAGVLRVDLDYVDGTISVDWLKVARLESKFLFIVQLQDGSVYSGNVVNPEALAGTPVKLEIKTEEGGAVVVDQTQVVRLTQMADSVAERLNGKITLGASYAKGNNTTQYNLGAVIGYQELRWGSQLSLNSNLSSSSGASAATRNQLDLTAYRLLARTNFFVAGTFGLLQSSVQQIDRQTILAVTLGRFLKNTNRVLLTVQGGLGGQRTVYSSSVNHTGAQNIAVALVSSNLQVFSFKKNRLDFTGTVVPALTDSGRLFTKFNTSYYVKLFGKIDWNLSVYGNWDTRPPLNFAGSDYGTSTGLSYTFGNR